MKKNEQLNKALESNLLLKNLKPDELNSLIEKSTIVKYRKRETVIKRGGFATHLILVLDGFVKVESDEGTKNFIIDIIEGENFIGLPLVLSFEKYIFSVVSLTDVNVVFIPMDYINKIIETNSKFALSVINYGNEKFVFPILDKLRSASHNNVRGGLAKLLLDFSREMHKSDSFTLLISRFEIAQMIGFSRENVIRMLTEFDSEDIIKISGKSIKIIDSKRLENLTEYS